MNSPVRPCQALIEANVNSQGASPACPARARHRAIFDFGRTNEVHHTNYFEKPKTVESLERWLGL